MHILLLILFISSCAKERFEHQDSTKQELNQNRSDSKPQTPRQIINHYSKNYRIISVDQIDIDGDRKQDYFIKIAGKGSFQEQEKKGLHFLAYCFVSSDFDEKYCGPWEEGAGILFTFFSIEDSNKRFGIEVYGDEEDPVTSGTYLIELDKEKWTPKRLVEIGQLRTLKNTTTNIQIEKFFDLLKSSLELETRIKKNSIEFLSGLDICDIDNRPVLFLKSLKNVKAEYPKTKHGALTKDFLAYRTLSEVIESPKLRQKLKICEKDSDCTFRITSFDKFMQCKPHIFNKRYTKIYDLCDKVCEDQYIEFKTTQKPKCIDNICSLIDKKTKR